MQTLLSIVRCKSHQQVTTANNCHTKQNGLKQISQIELLGIRSRKTIASEIAAILLTISKMIYQEESKQNQRQQPLPAEPCAYVTVKQPKLGNGDTQEFLLRQLTCSLQCRRQDNKCSQSYEPLPTKLLKADIL